MRTERVDYLCVCVWAFTVAVLTMAVGRPASGASSAAAGAAAATAASAVTVDAGCFQSQMSHGQSGS